MVGELRFAETCTLKVGRWTLNVCHQLAQSYRITHTNLQFLGCRAVTDGDLQQAAASDEGDWFSGSDIPIGSFQLSNTPPMNAYGGCLCGLQQFGGDVGGCVAEMIDVDHFTAMGIGGGREFKAERVVKGRRQRLLKK